MRHLYYIVYDLFVVVLAMVVVAGLT